MIHWSTVLYEEELVYVAAWETFGDLVLKTQGSSREDAGKTQVGPCWKGLGVELCALLTVHGGDVGVRGRGAHRG